ncbi:MAG: hypothetical protein AB7S38_29075 [Vulcanimicrobiota bacterium]
MERQIGIDFSSVTNEDSPLKMQRLSGKGDDTRIQIMKPRFNPDTGAEEEPELLSLRLADLKRVKAQTESDLEKYTASANEQIAGMEAAIAKVEAGELRTIGE